MAILRIVLVTSNTFPKGCHLFGGDGRQAEATTIRRFTALDKLAMRRLPIFLTLELLEVVCYHDFHLSCILTQELLEVVLQYHGFSCRVPCCHAACGAYSRLGYLVEKVHFHHESRLIL